jgi:hypothetical protein
MPLSNTTQDILRSSPYWDDYDRDKRFHRVLIKPRTPVQTRELNQVQSILQNQVEQVTSSVYREGAAVSGGQQTLDTNGVVLQVVRNDAVDINNFFNPETNVGALAEGLTSGARAIVIQVSKQPTSSYAAILFAPLSATSFDPEESVQFSDITTGDAITTMVVAPGTAATNVASTFSVEKGVFYLRGHLVEVPKQTIILNTGSQSPSKRVGFTILESIVTAADDATLLDPALGTTNYAGPGADRLKISAILTAKDILDDRIATNSNTDFIEIARIVEGVIQPQPDRLQSTFIENTLARRTNDESGDYVVKPFRLLVKDHNPPLNIPNITGFVTGNATSPIIQGANIITTITLANGSTSNVTTLFESEIVVGDVLVVNGERRKVVSITSNTALVVNAAFTIEFTNTVATVVSADKLNIELEAGKAYVRGYEIETRGVSKIPVDRARTTQTVDNGTVSTGFGPYVIVTRDTGLFNINTMEQVDLHCVPFSNVNVNLVNATAGNYLSSKIGTARVRSFLYHSGIGDANTTYKMYLVGAEFQTKTFTVTGDANSNVQLTGVAKNLSAKTLTLTQNASSSSGGALPVGNHAFVGATVKLYTVDGYEVSYPVLASVDSSNTTTLRQHTLTLDSDDVLGTVNTTANVQVTFSDKCIRSMTNNANTKTKGTSVSIFGKVGYAANGNTVMQNTNATPLLFRYRGGVIEPNTITDENYEVLRYLGSVSGNDSVTTGNVVFTINSLTVALGTGEFPYPQSEDVFHYIVASLSSNGCPIPLNAAVADVDDYTIRMGVPNTAISGFTSPGTTTIDVYARMAVDSNGARTKTLYVGNTSLSSVGVNSLGMLISNTNNNKGHIAINSINTSSNRVVSLGIADVNAIKKIYAVKDANTISTNTSAVVDVTDNYQFDSGQRDWCYDFSSIELKAGKVHYTTNCSQLLVIVDRWAHSAATAGLGYFNPASYSGVAIEEIPVFVNSKNGDVKPLATHVDFRPVRTTNLASANTATNPYTSGTVTFDTTVLPYPMASYRADYEFYLPRVDKLVLTKDKRFRVITGTPAVDPQVPGDDPDGITLYVMSYPAYTPFANTVVVHPFEYRRYTMKDIRTLEKRIENLEYYAALSTMDLQSLNNPELDEYDNERFKNGIVTDNFSTDKVGNFKHRDMTVALDHENQQMRPRGVVRQKSLTVNPTGSSNVQEMGTGGSKLISLTYTQVPLVTQGLASKSININPFNVFSWIGSIRMFPSSDTWIDTITKPDLVVSLFNENDGIVDGETVSTSWNYWETSVTGSPTTEVSHWTGWKTGTTDPNNPHPDQEWARGTAGVREQEWLVTKTITPTTTTNYAQATFAHTKVSTITTDLGERVIDQSIAHKMRGIDVDIMSGGLLPGATLRATFDEIDVTNYMERANRITITDTNAATFQVGDIITTNGGATARIVGIVTNASTGTAYLYVTDARGAFAGATITSRQNPDALVGQTTVSGVSITGYDHWHGQAQQVTSNSPWTLRLGTGAVTTSDPYTGKIIHFTDGGYLRYVNLLDNTTPTVATSGVAGYMARITSYNPSTRDVVLEGLPGDVSAAFAQQFTSYTTDNPIRYSIGDLQTTGTGNTTASAVSPGSFFGMFRLPGMRQPTGAGANANMRVMSTDLQFNTGTRVFRLENITPNSLIESSARRQFSAQGTTVVKQKEIVRTRQTESWTTQGEITSSSSTTTNVDEDWEFIRYIDPLAQTFLISKEEYPNGVYITAVDLFFGKKGVTDMDVTVELRTTVNGVPSADTTLAKATVTAGNIKVVPTGVTPSPGNSSHYTRFTFDTPQYLAPNFEYAFVVLSNSNEYEVFVGELGKQLIGSSNIITQQPHGGVLFKSQNARTWVPEPLEDLTFVIHRAEFSMSQGTLALQLANNYSTLIDEIDYDLLYLGVDHLDFPATQQYTHYTLKTVNTSDVASSQVFTPNMTVAMSERKRIVEGHASSLQLTATLRTSNSHVSPVYDVERLSALLIKNMVDNGRLYANGVAFTAATPNTSASANYSTSGNSYALTVSGGNGTGAVLYANTNTTGYVTSIYVANAGYGYTETPTLAMASNTDFTATGQPTFTYVGETSGTSRVYGEQKARYLTLPITLADGFDAGDLKVYLSAVRAPQHNIDVYYRILATGDPQKFEEKPWTLMVLKEGQEELYSTSSAIRREYEYRTVDNKASYVSNGTTFDRFHTFAIKVVLRSSKTDSPYEVDTVNVPLISNLRIIALDE